MSKSKKRWVLVVLVGFAISSLLGGLLVGFDWYLSHNKKVCPLSQVVKIIVIGKEIDWYTGELAKWQGSGVLIEDDLVLTAGHIVEDANEIMIILQNGKEYPGGDWYKETEVDLGIIRVFTPEKELVLSFDDAVLGEEVWVFGNSLGVFPVLTKGIISATNTPDSYDNTKYMIITDAAANGGNSGCPLFDKWGNILGICSWHFPGQEGMNYFVRAEVIELVLEKYDAIRALERIE